MPWLFIAIIMKGKESWESEKKNKKQSKAKQSKNKLNQNKTKIFPSPLFLPTD